MADIFPELISIMQEETRRYKTLYDFAVKKREIIVARELEPLEKLTTEEQNIASELKNLETRRLNALKQYASEKGMSSGTPKVSEIIDTLSDDSSKKALAQARDDLVQAASKMQFMNGQNELLLRQALEMVEFDLTLFKSMRQAPETANYGRDAYSTGDILPKGGFDAKQ